MGRQVGPGNGLKPVGLGYLEFRRRPSGRLCGRYSGPVVSSTKPAAPSSERPASPLVGDGFNMLAEASGYWTTTLAVCGCTTETVRIVVAGS